MLDFFRKRRERQFDEYIKQIKEREKIEAAVEFNRKKELEIIAAELIASREAELKNSDKEYIVVKGAEIDNNGIIKITLDWNDAFIKYLREQCNFQGDEDQIVQKYLGGLFKEIYTNSNNDSLNILSQPGAELTPDIVARISKDIKENEE